MLFRSSKYPELRVIEAGVKFRAGEAEVTDEAAIARLVALAHLGVVPVETAEPVEQEASAESAETGNADDQVVPVETAEPKRKPGRPKKSDS